LKGWNLINVNAFSWGGLNNPKVTHEHHTTATKDDHEIHSNLTGTIKKEGVGKMDNNTAYIFRQKKYMVFADHKWSNHSLLDASTAFGFNYKANDKINIAYRAEHDHANRTLSHSAGLSQKTLKDKLFYKTQFEGIHSTKGGDLSECTWKLYFDHKICQGFEWKGSFSTNMKDLKNYNFGFVLSSIC